MKLYTLILAVAFITVGCSSSDDNPPLDDGGTTTGDGTNQGELPSDIAQNTRRIFEILNGNAIEEMAAVQIRLDQAEELGFDLISTSFDPEISDDVNLFACPGGGTVGNSFISISGGSTLSTNTADSCDLGDIVVSGSFIVNTSSGRGANVGVFDNTVSVSNYIFNVVDNGNSTLMAKAAIRTRGLFDSGTFSERKTFTELSNVSSETSYSVESAEVTISDSAEPFSGFEDGISINIASLISDDTLSAATDTPLQFNSGISNPNPISGVLEISGQNAAWQFDADGGDPESVTITVNTMGSTIGYQIPKSMFTIEFVDPSRASF